MLVSLAMEQSNCFPEFQATEYSNHDTHCKLSDSDGLCGERRAAGLAFPEGLRGCTGTGVCAAREQGKPSAMNDNVILLPEAAVC